jgi:hypothetical protein
MSSESPFSAVRSFDPSTAAIADPPQPVTQPAGDDAAISVGTDAPGSGVPSIGSSDPVAPLRMRGLSRSGVLGVLGLLLGCLGLLGEGERCLVDARFRTPDATLRTYWEGLRRGDADVVWACFTEGRADLPVPGQLWFLPPTEKLDLAGMRVLPVDPNRVMVTYEVRYVPRGLSELRSFRTGDELVRMRGEWRISRPIGEASMPDPEPIPRPVDS